MNSPASSHAARDSLTEQAAHWCMRVHADDCTDAERKAFEAWLKSNPAHTDEYLAMLDIWTLSEQLPRHPFQNSNPPAAAHFGHSRSRSPRRVIAAAAMALLVLPLAGYMGWQLGWLPSSYHRYHAGEITREVILADGSQVQLNLNTALSFSDYRDSRVVNLSEGEAFFKVQHDSTHPFVVKAGKGSITVTGTQFNVWKYEDQVVVTLSEGSVKVRSDLDQPDRIAYLSPGMQARYSKNYREPQVSLADPAEALAWREGKLILDDLPLSEALPLINRYLHKPVLLADASTARIRIGGIYNIDNVEGLVQALPKVLPVSLAQDRDGNTVIKSKSSLL